MGNESFGTALARWKPAAAALEGATPYRGSLRALYDHAMALARFHARYYRRRVDAGGRVVRRGLEDVAGAPAARATVDAATGDEIRSLVEAIQQAHASYLLWTEPSPKGARAERGRFVLRELASVLEWHFDDGSDDEAPWVAGRTGEGDEPESLAALAADLEDHARLAEPHRRALDGVGGFDARMIDEALEIAASLRARARAETLRPEALAAAALRDRLVALLVRRVSLVRAAARFVFRDDPGVARLASSVAPRRERVVAPRTPTTRAPARPLAIDATEPDRAAVV